MKLAYICSPYRGDVKRNKAYARELVRWAIENGYTPICPHLYITEVLNDDNPAERKRGTLLGFYLLDACDVVIVGQKYGISEGMSEEIKLGRGLGKQILDVYFFSEACSRQYETKK